MHVEPTDGCWPRPTADNRVKHYYKLVRDRILEILEQKGLEYVSDIIVNDEEFAAYLDQKLEEETKEYLVSREPEKLADILEVIHAIAKTQGLTFDDLEALRMQKREVRGGFDARYFLYWARGDQ